MTPQEWRDDCKTRLGAAKRALSVVKRRHARESIYKDPHTRTAAMHRQWAECSSADDKSRAEALRLAAYHDIMAKAEAAMEAFLEEQIQEAQYDLRRVEEELKKS